ncbi:MAG: hypothetical protein KAX39_06730, partial [candidate division Zixibacteria bacterium]|nr:hypothetical protein [candidate division Zixibacteria bacterium]
MKAKILTFMVFLSFGLGIFVGDGFSATAAKKSLDPKWTRHISGNVNVDGAGFDLYRAPSKGISKYLPTSTKQITCDSINPEAGTIIQHDYIGDTWYDEQQVGSIGRMISVTPGGYRHFSWTYCDHQFTPGPRYVDANCKDPAGAYISQVHADGDGLENGTNPGYCNQTHEHDGVSVIIHHRTGPPYPGYSWNTTITMDYVLCGGFFDRHWDLPDAINGAPSGERGMWPKGEVCYDALVDTDYVHVVMTEGNTEGYEPVVLAWERTHRIVGDAMVCEACLNGARVAYTVPLNTDMGWNGAFPAIDHFDTSCNATPVVAVSPVSQKVAIAYLHPSCDGSCDYFSDVYYIESMNNGEDWLSDCANWPPTPNVVVQYGCGTPNERAYVDVAACYDYEDNLHIVWNAHYFDPKYPEALSPIAKLYHWSYEHGISLITSGYPEDLKPPGKITVRPWWWPQPPGPDTKTGKWGGTVCKPSIAAVDQIYHPGGDPDSVYLYCIWTQFDSSDISANGHCNGDIYGAGSFCGGSCWDEPFNLTNTKTPGCDPGDCVSEHWASLAQNMYNGDLHIQYICDLDAGAAPQQYEGEWMEVP